MGANCDCCEPSPIQYGQFPGQASGPYGGQPGYPPAMNYNQPGAPIYNPVTIRGSLVDTVAGLATPTLPAPGNLLPHNPYGPHVHRHPLILN